MKLTPEQLRLNAAAMIAWADGKPVETKEGNADSWRRTDAPIWDFENNEYRPASEPVRRPWNRPEDVPGPVCWIRVKSDPNLEMMVISIWLVGIGFRDAGQRSLTKQYSELDGLEHSTDRINWKPCTVEEVA